MRPTRPPVKEVEQVRDFDQEYNVVNKLLPVDRVQFGRPDHMSAIGDTSSDLLVYGVFWKMFHPLTTKTDSLGTVQRDPLVALSWWSR